jgi:hypothetical protein
LQAVGAGEGAGRAAVTLQGPGVAGGTPGAPVQVRFRVIATAATSTSINVSGQAVDVGGVPVPLVTPGVHAVNVTAQ